MSPRIHALVPAAGRSRRMGAAKQLLDIGGRTMVRAVLDPLAAARVHQIILITHSAVAAAVERDLPPAVSIVVNDDETSDMIDSIRLGLAACRGGHPRPADGVLVCPADHPGISTGDFDGCIAEFGRAPERIIIGALNSRRGHPIVFPWRLAEFVDSPACDAGLNQLARAHADLVTLVECRSTAILRDIDTPDDLRDA